MDNAALDTLIVYGTSALAQYGNVSYLTGTLTGNLPGNKGVYCVIRSGLPPVLVTTSRMERRAVSLSITQGIETIEPAHPGRAAQLALVAGLCRGRSPALAGPPHVPYADGLALREHMRRELPVVDLVGEARRSLTAEDHACMRVEARRIEEALTGVIANLGPGLTERDLAAAIEGQLIRRGSQVRIVHVCAGHFHGQAPGLDVIGDGDLLTVLPKAPARRGTGLRSAS
jgi:Xaa-Pro aminopeptidase